MKNIDPLVIKQLIKEDMLGNLRILYKVNVVKDPKEKNQRLYKIILKDFFQYITNNDLFTNCAIDYSDIHSVCLFGSVLYRHIPIPIEYEPEVLSVRGNLVVKKTKTKELPRPLPKDIDILIVLNKNVLKEKEKVVKKGSCGKQRVFKKEVYNSDGYGGTSTRWASTDSDLSVDINFRTISQFLNGINEGDIVSTYVAEFGIPFVGQNNFYKMLRNIKNNRRRVMHKIKWVINKSKKCSANCESIWWKKYSLEDEKIRREATVPKEVKIKSERFDFMEFD